MKINFSPIERILIWQDQVVVAAVTVEADGAADMAGDSMAVAVISVAAVLHDSKIQ